MNREEFLKKYKKDELIKRIMMLEEELAECEADLDAREAELKEKSTKLSELEGFKKETDSWSKSFIKTLLSNEDNRKLLVSGLEENINSVIDARVTEKLETETKYYDGERYMSVTYNGFEV